MKDLFGWRAWLFALKTFAAMMAALFIAFSVDLSRPYWAVMTVYVVANPSTSASRSKGLYRFCGTLLGAAASVVIVPNLVNAPELLSVALALWSGLCIAFALFDRSARSYVFLLAGYSTALIGFPSVATPDLIFDTAIDRVQEIGIAIACVTMLDCIFPSKSMFEPLQARVAGWRRDARLWMRAAFDGRASTDGDTRRRLALDLGELDRSIGTFRFDRRADKQVLASLRQIQHLFDLLLPITSAISDRVAAFKEADGGVPEPLVRLLADISASVESGLDRATHDKFAERIAALKPALRADSDWRDLTMVALLTRLSDLLDLARDIESLSRCLTDTPDDGAQLETSRHGRVRHRHVDASLAFLSGATCVISILICCAFWIATGWPEGFIAAEMAAVACAFFASLDDPAPAIRTFATQAAIGTVVAIVYLFAIMPRVDSFEMLALVMAPFFIPAGLLMANPRTMFWGLGIAANTAASLAFPSSYNADFAATLAAGAATVLGMVLACVMTSIMRSLTPRIALARLLKANRRDVARAARLSSIVTPPGQPRHGRLTEIMVDRLGLIAARVRPDMDAEALSIDTLRELRIGINALELAGLIDDLPPSKHQAARDVLKAISKTMQTAGGVAAFVPPSEVLDPLDAIIAMVLADQERAARDRLLMALGGLRRALFPKAQPYTNPAQWKAAA